jgi:hypothetical protein
MELFMSTRIGSLALVAVLSALASLATGCGSKDDSSDGAPADQGADLSAASGNQPLSQDLLCAAVKAADDDGSDPQGNKLKPVAQSALKGDAAKDFKSFQKNMLPDFPSQAFELPVPLNGKTFTFLMVVDNNDGGQSLGIYRTDGSNVATVFNSESEQGTWSKPADKCPE